MGEAHDMRSDTVLPRFGRHWRELEREIAGLQQQDMPMEGGTFQRHWPLQPSGVYLAAREAYALFAGTNAFVLSDLPSLQELDRQLRGMVAEILRVPAGGDVMLTAGGTESNFLVVKAARARARELGIDGRPEIVIPYTAHPSFDKSADDLCMDVVRVPVGQQYRADVELLRPAITPKTALIVGSAPSYPHGVVDPIPQMAALAAEHDVWFHVDSCVGGFLLPFLRKLGRCPYEFDFAVDGVWSVSADLHKLGFCLNGISTLSFRDASLRRLHTFTLESGPPTGWPYRRYIRAGFLGSRSGGVVAAAWAVMQTLGAEGYLELARGILETSDRLASAVEHIDGLSLVAPPEAGVLAIRSTEGLDIPAVATVLLELGWDAVCCEDPPALHLLPTPLPGPVVDRFVADLERAVVRVRDGYLVGNARTMKYGD